MALVMIGGALHGVVPSNAEESVCGDGNTVPTEQCDDGNLTKGDGCSSQCTIERCGNLFVDSNEQCDDGNLRGNDGCNQYCQVEFCGDSVVQPALPEQCDDGNGISGDGCSAVCTSETSHPAGSSSSSSSSNSSLSSSSFSSSSFSSSSSSFSSSSSAPFTPPPPPPFPPTIPLPLTEAMKVEKFLESDASEELKERLTTQENTDLVTIVKQLVKQTPLTQDQRSLTDGLTVSVGNALVSVRDSYTDLLKKFIATPISDDVVQEKQLEKTNLVNVAVPIAINELKEAVQVIKRGELKREVLFQIANLQRQGVSITADVPADFGEYLNPGQRPILVFATLKTLKEAAEKRATTDVPASLDVILMEAEKLKLALPIFEQEYGLRPEEVEPLLTAIEDVSKEATKHDVERVVSAINRFLGTLQRSKVLSKVDIASFEASPVHAAAQATRIAKTIGLDRAIKAPQDVAPFLEELIASTPSDATKRSFEKGAVAVQRQALLTYIAQDERMTELRGVLRKEGSTEFDVRYAALRDDIERAGDPMDSPTPCDDSVPDALSCVSQYTLDLEEAYRSRSVFTRIIGSLQDFFGVGS